jgi:peptidyl-prolyl cis-trans isomerase A (cyclophilin A)
MKLFISLFLILMLFSCNQKEKQNKNNDTVVQQQPTQEAGWEEVFPAIVEIETFDDNRILESGQGFFVTEDIIVTRYSMVRQANRVTFSPLDTDQKYQTSKYVAVDRINDLILLKAENVKRKPVELFGGNVPNASKTILLAVTPGKNLQLFSGKVHNLSSVQGSMLYRISNRVRNNNFGAPVFTSDKKTIGVAFSDVVSYEMQSLVIPSDYISRLLEKQNNDPLNLEALRSLSSGMSEAEIRSIKGFLLETDMGNITIRLYNETPEYRDNFIRLANEQFYDSLLIHRIIARFGIQTGAADTRYAEKGDLVGWKGPGYTLPAHIQKNIFHKRGTIGSPRKPDTQNQRRRSDGSQFYIVSGRTYTDLELNEIEKENDYKFTAEQRQVYKSSGGAPHLDGSYTVFGEVVSGMEVVDKMVQVETDREWRPVTDIRLKKVTILK